MFTQGPSELQPQAQLTELVEGLKSMQWENGAQDGSVGHWGAGWEEPQGKPTL